MKIILILISSFLIIFQSSGQEGHFYFEGDTLVVTNSDIVLDPFTFGADPLGYLKMNKLISIEYLVKKKTGTSKIKLTHYFH